MGIIKNGHEYVKAFRSETIVENYLCIAQDDEYYYYVCDSNWRGNTKLHNNEVVLCNNEDEENKIDTIGMILTKYLMRTENPHWRKETHQSYADSTGQTTREYSKDAFEVIYRFIESHAVSFSCPINHFATIENIKTYFKQLTIYEEKIQNIDSQRQQIDKERKNIIDELVDYQNNKSYNVMYVEPYIN